MTALVPMLDYCNIKTGKLDSNAATHDGEYPFFTCSPETLRIDKYAFDEEAVLLAGNNASGVFPVKYFDGQFNAYQRTYILNSNSPDLLATRYLYYALKLQLENLKNLSTGAATKFLTLGILKTIQIPRPKITDQLRIVECLSAYDDLIETNHRRITLLEESARLLYREWFVKLRFPGHEAVIWQDGFPEGWKKCYLKDIATLNYGKALKESDRVAGEVPVYGSSGIVGTHDKPLIDGPVIIVGRKGNVGSVFFSDVPCFAIDTVYFISGSEVNYYLFQLLQTMNFISSDSAVPGLNRNYTYGLEVLYPDTSTLIRFEETVAPIFQQISLLKRQNIVLQNVRDELLPRLMSGAIQV